MTCSSCQSHVEKAVNKLQGIQNVTVNLLSNDMTVTYDENVMNNEKIIQAVVEAGYGASLYEKVKETNKRQEKADPNDNDRKNMKKRLILSTCFLVPLMYIAMYHMLNEWFGLPIPKMINNLFHGSQNAINFALTQFLLLLPILYVNRNFFIVGFKRLAKGTPNMDTLIAIGSTAATIYGIFALYKIGYGLGHNQMAVVERYSMDIYFESAGTILTLITLRKILRS